MTCVIDLDCCSMGLLCLSSNWMLAFKDTFIVTGTYSDTVLEEILTCMDEWLV